MGAPQPKECKTPPLVEAASSRNAQIDIESTVQTALACYEREPQLGRRFAHDAWAACLRAEPEIDAELAARCALAYGRALIRAEQPHLATPILAAAHSRWEQLGRPDWVAVCDWQIGMALQQQTDFYPAVETLQKAACDLEETGRALDAARCRRDLAVTYNLQGRSDQAAAPLEAARRAFAAVHDEAELARCDLVDAARLQGRGQYTEAFQLLDRALPVIQAAGLTVEIGIAHYVRAFLYMRRDTIVQVEADLAKAKQIFQSIPLPRRIARCDNVLGGAYLRSLLPLKAIHPLEQATRWFASNDMPVEAAWSRSNLSIAYQLLGDYTRAHQILADALPKMEAAGALASVANSMNQMGVILLAEGRLEEALTVLEKSTRVAQEIKAQHTAAVGARHLALTFLLLGQPDKAWEWLERALEGFRQIESGIQVTRTQLEMSRLALEMNLGDRAQQLAAEALTGCEHPGDIARCEFLLGRAILEKKECQPAENQLADRLLASSTSRFTEIGMTVNALESQISWALAIRRASNRNDKAREVLQQVMLEASNHHLPEMAWQAALALADLERDAGSAERELGHLEKARHLLALARRRLAQPALEAGYLSKRLGFLERGMNLALDLNRPESALLFSDEMRSQSLTVQLQVPFSRTGQSESLNDLVDQRRRLLQELSMLQRELADHALSQAAALSWEHSILLQRHHEIAHHFEQVSLEMERAGRIWQPEPTDIALFEPALLQDPDWTVLAYHLQAERLIVFILSAGAVLVVERPLWGLDKSALDMCTAPSTRDAVFGLPEHPLYNPDLSTLFRQQLYQLLIPEQILPQLDPDRPLIIVPHGDLFSLPFHTLLAPDGQPLIHQAAVSYVPSLALLQALKHASQEPAGQFAEEALVIGVEEYNGRYPVLRRAGNEVRVIAAGLAEPKTLLLNEAANRARLETMAGRYRLLHLATHGLSNSQHGLLAGIALADQDLRIDDLAQLGVTAPLVVLSACETGLGIGDTLSNSRGVAGVFFALGAQHVVATLWPADDSFTAALMVAFYRELSSGTSPAIALARAQRSRTSLPVCHWASAACFGLP